jgi:DMSO/TMAO reductase YedYZ molybdopterin-dependent catalytic subunit
MAELERPVPGLNRRDFLRLGLVAGPAALVAACEWDGGPLVEGGLERMSRLNDWMGEHLFLSKTRLAPTYPAWARQGMQMPAYFVSDDVPMLEHPDEWALAVGGLVRKPMRLSLAELQRLPLASYTVKHHCVEGWTAIATWTGVPVRAILDLVQPTADAQYLRFDSFDSDYSNGWDLATAAHPQTILAYAHNDKPLAPDHGAPLRLYSPLKLGYKLTKYLTAMTLTRDRPGGYWEDRGYPWFGGV